MTRGQAISKVRKLLARAKSNPGPEADNAKVRAQELCEKYHITVEEAEPSEIVTSVIEQTSEPWRELLAFSVAKYHACRVFTLKKGGISISGDKRAHDKAAALYVSLLDFVLHACPTRPPITLNHNSPIPLLDEVWRERFYHGFVKALSKRLIPVDAPEPPRAVAYEAVPDEVAQAVREESTAAEEQTDDEETVDDVGEDIDQEHTKNARETLLEKGFRLVEALSHGFRGQYGADLAAGIYDLAYIKGIDSGTHVDIDKHVVRINNDMHLEAPEIVVDNIVMPIVP